MSESYISQIKKCVAFVFIKKNKQIVANGTGFFVSIPTGYDKNKAYKYFVTAKHVLRDQEGNFYSEIGIRLNKFPNNSEIVWLQKEFLSIYTHTDKDVDIALFPCVPDEKIYDFLTIDHTLLSNSEIILQNKIEEGTDVLFTGLFTSHMGQKRNQPIVRFGKTALLSDEKIEWSDDGKSSQLLELYLMECLSFGGNSGAPVFFKPDRLREIETMKIKGETYFLAGIMKGYFNTNAPIAVTQTDYKLSAAQNIGIAGVVPAYQLKEILFCDELKKLREDNDKKISESKKG